MSRSHRERQNYEDDDRDHGRRSKNLDRDRGGPRAASPPPRETKKSRPSNLNEYFVDGKDILREVLQKEICKYLGPEATSKPSSYKGVDGYLIRAVRPFTGEMLEDLIALSRSYKTERDDERRRGGRVIPYDESLSSRRHDAGVGGRQQPPRQQEDYYDEVPREVHPPRDGRDPRDPYGTRDTRLPPSNPYPSSTSQGIYPPHMAHAPPPHGFGYPAYDPMGLPPRTGIPPSVSPYDPVPGYPPSGYPAASRSSDESMYTYTGEHTGTRDQYGRPSVGYPVPNTRADISRMEPGSSRQYGSSSRPDPRDLRPEPRHPMTYMASPTDDVDMGGTDPRYDYGLPAVRGHPGGYDRNSPGIREQYRPEPPREERRQRR